MIRITGMFGRVIRQISLNSLTKGDAFLTQKKGIVSIKHVV